MKKTIYIVAFMIGALVFSCTPDKYEIFDFESNISKIDSIELAPESHILYADGVSQLNIRVHAFETVQLWRKDKINLPDGSEGTKDSLYTYIYRVQNSRLTNDIEFYKDDGTRLPENAKITTTTVEDFKVYAKIGDVQSEMLEIDVREPFPEKEKKVIPVIVHYIKSEAEGGDAMPSIDTKYLQGRMDALNEAFNQRTYPASNGANANVEFKLALYAPDGTRLEEDGINRVTTSLDGYASRPVLIENTWDSKKYMNVYVCGYSPSTPAPSVKLAGVDPILGLSFTDIEADEELDLSSPEKIGPIFGAYYFGTYLYLISYSFHWETHFAKYLGLLSPRVEDYCDDTYSYLSSGVEGWALSRDGRVYYPTNLLGRGTVAVLSGEQVERIHWVLENCPTHWAWKSDFAFTGVE